MIEMSKHTKQTPKWMLDPIEEFLKTLPNDKRYCEGCGQEILTHHLLDWKCGDCWNKEFNEYQSCR